MRVCVGGHIPFSLGDKLIFNIFFKKYLKSSFTSFSPTRTSNIDTIFLIMFPPRPPHIQLNCSSLAVICYLLIQALGNSFHIILLLQLVWNRFDHCGMLIGFGQERFVHMFPRHGASVNNYRCIQSGFLTFPFLLKFICIILFKFLFFFLSVARASNWTMKNIHSLCFLFEIKWTCCYGYSSPYDREFMLIVRFIDEYTLQHLPFFQSHNLLPFVAYHEL